MSSRETDSRRAMIGPDLFAHHFLPPGLRRQLAGIWRAWLASLGESGVDCPRTIRKLVCAEHGIERLHLAASTDADDLAACLISSPRIEVVLDVIGFSLLMLSAEGLDTLARSAVDAVNDLFRQYGVGGAFAFEDGALVRADDRARHDKFVAPALAALSDPRRELARSLYRAAFAAYDLGRWSDCMGKCCETISAVLLAESTAGNLAPFAHRLSANEIRTILADSGAPPELEPPLAMLGSMQGLLVAARATSANRDPISPRQARDSLHSTAAAILVATASG